MQQGTIDLIPIQRFHSILLRPPYIHQATLRQFGCLQQVAGNWLSSVCSESGFLQLVA